MKKVLFTIQWYPSVLSANALCDEKIISALLATGEYEVHCLVYKPLGAVADAELNGVHVHRFRRSYWWDKVIAAKTAKDKKSKIILKIDKIIMRLNQLFFAPFYPTTHPHICRTFAKKAIQLHKKENFDIVISEYHGEDSLYAGYTLKKEFPSIKFVSIFWDALAMKQPAKYLPKGFAVKRLQKSEQKVAAVADRIIQMNISEQAYASYLKDNLFADKYRFFGLPGIVKQLKVEGEAQFIEKGKINIVYAGILNLPERDPEPLVRALAGIEMAKDLNLIFLCTGEGKEKLYKLSADFAGGIVIHGYVSQNEIKKIYQDVDIFLNFGGANPYMMPSKLLEYMSYGKPIISGYYIDNDSSQRYLQRYPLACCVDTREGVKKITKEIEDFIKTSLNVRVPFEQVKELYKENTPEAYVEEIKLLLRE